MRQTWTHSPAHCADPECTFDTSCPKFPTLHDRIQAVRNLFDLYYADDWDFPLWQLVQDVLTVGYLERLDVTPLVATAIQAKTVYEQEEKS